MPKKLTKEEFIEKSKLKHGNKYNYSKSVYINSKTKLTIICKTHGEFTQTSGDHLDGCGCPKCDPTSTLGNEKFIKKSKLKHGDKYDYSKVEYKKNNYDKVEIICHVHGSFFQRPWAHLRGQGCPYCVNNKKSNTEEFILKSNKKHNNLYDYSLVEYKTKKEKVKIICLKHGIFEQKAYVHLQGHGCPICRNSKLEKYLRDKLKSFNFNFEQNKRFDNCRNVLPLPFDFFIKDLDVLIECDGIHHRKAVEHFGGENRLKYQKNNDSIKNKYCFDNNIKLIRINNFSDIDKLFILVFV